MRYSQLRDLIQPHIDEHFPRTPISVGPELPEHASQCVVLSPFGGGGEQVDGLIEATGWQVRAIGKQNSYESAEDLAWSIDTFLRRIRSGRYGGIYIVEIPRLGNPPTTLMVDDADRHHFVCSYMPTVESALAS